MAQPKPSVETIGKALESSKMGKGVRLKVLGEKRPVTDKIKTNIQNSK